MMKLKPVMKDWNLYFLRSIGFEKRDIIIKSISEFIQDKTLMRMEVPGNCMLFGKVYGHNLYKEGGGIIASGVVRIERRHKKSDQGEETYCIVTKTSKYYCYLSDCSKNMKRMLDDINTGSLKRIHGYYLEDSRFTRGEKLL